MFFISGILNFSVVSFNLVRKVRTLILFLLGLACSVQFNACQAPEISDNQTLPIDSVAVDSATFKISNQIAQDPGSITVFLFPQNSTDILTATNRKTVGAIQAGEFLTFKVPVGKWKIAYQDKSGNLYPMEDESAGGGVWLRSDFQKGSVYTLLLGTDGNVTVWIVDYPTVPPIQSIVK